MAIVIGIVAGLVLVGLATGSFAGAVLGAALGGFLGYVIGHKPKPATAAAPPHPSVTAPAAAGETLAGRVDMLERRVLELERALRLSAAPEAPDVESAPMSQVPADVAPETAALPPPVVVPATAPIAIASASPGLNADGTLALPAAEAAPAPAMDLGTTVAPPPPQPNPIWAWIVGGNTLARLGVLLLFIGVAFLLKYAVDHVHVPISVRLAGVALGAVVLLVIGWRLRTRRTAYAMAMQGGGVGILYLTVFAALRLYQLVDPLVAFGLLLWICGVSSWLAIKQDALSLAVLAVVGGFLAPILISRDSGDHIMLFSYYALLNAGILGIAWFKAWRVLNLLGFAFTFIVGTLWGVTRYDPKHFATTEPFLVLFFLFYVAIAVLYALRRSVELRNYVDAGLVFGTPLVAAGLQSALIRHIEYGMAISALAMSAVYLVLARYLYSRRREELRLLVESFLALGVVFATLAIPLALDARWTSAAWALEGAAIVWVGMRQQRAAVRVFGYVLEFGAGIAFILGLELWRPGALPSPYPIVNSAFVGAVLVALAGLFTAWLLERHRDRVAEWERPVAIVTFAWGALWWLFAGWRDIHRFVALDYRLPAVVALLAATAVMFAILERRLRWPAARVPQMLLLPLLLVAAIAAIGRLSSKLEPMLAFGGFIAWPLAIAAVAMLLWRYDRQEDAESPKLPRTIEPWHAGLYWLVLLIVTHDVSWAGTRIANGHSVWSQAPWGLVPALSIVAIGALASKSSWPIALHRRGYLIIGIVPVALLLVLWSIGASIYGDGDPAPLPYFPILNPLDLTQAIVLIALASWAVFARREDPAVFRALPTAAVVATLCVLAFLWINAVALRTIHFAIDVPYTPRALWSSTVVQAVLSLLWSSIALATMAFANRRQWRIAWIVGAALLAAVVVKLFFVELAQSGTITRIVSFIGVGLLLLLIGYVAPVPPRRKENAP